MARLTIESQAAPAAQGPLEARLQELVGIGLSLCVGLATGNPGILIGAAVMLVCWWLFRPSWQERLGCALALLVPLVALRHHLIWNWSLRDLLAAVFPDKVASLSRESVLRTAATEALAGPLWFEAMLLFVTLSRRRVDAQIRRDHRLDKQRWRAITGRRQPTMPDPPTRQTDTRPGHPAGRIRLGVDAETNRPLDLELPAELATHVFLPGASGTGKTTTVARLADGALANGYGVVIVDCKGGGLGGAARRLAAHHGVPFNLVDPDDPDSLGYNPCSG
ncbi:MAG: Type secretion-system coupling protein DNA-binding domain, partial [Microbacteriaceae bacterium]|nr:Type secretion-system coupling protein DNA-binding domain [Microbacteriaceae bacterium]